MILNVEAPRGWLGKSAGVFSLANSDVYCGSYISISDASEILKISPKAFDFLNPVKHGGNSYVTDQQLGRAWASNQFSGSPRHLFAANGARVSFDEIILIAIIENTLPGAIVESQVEIGTRTVDMRITYKEERKLVEFYGPYHYIKRSRNERIPKHPSDRVAYIRRETDDECVIWPYWIQRCSANVKALFDHNVEGVSSIWSTSAQFGDFFFNDSQAVILDSMQRFNALKEGGVGYVYTDEFVRKPIHPIIQKIARGITDYRLLIPPGIVKEDKFWLPRALWPIL